MNVTFSYFTPNYAERQLHDSCPQHSCSILYCHGLEKALEGNDSLNFLVDYLQFGALFENRGLSALA